MVVMYKLCWSTKWLRWAFLWTINVMGPEYKPQECTHNYMVHYLCILRFTQLHKTIVSPNTDLTRRTDWRLHFITEYTFSGVRIVFIWRRKFTNVMSASSYEKWENIRFWVDKAWLMNWKEWAWPHIWEEKAAGVAWNSGAEKIWCIFSYYYLSVWLQALLNLRIIPVSNSCAMWTETKILKFLREDHQILKLQ